MKGKPTRKCSIFLVAVMVVGAFLNAFAWFPQAAKAAGSGTADDPYIITTAAELNNIRSNLGGHYRLGGNINLSAYTTWDPIGTSVAPFTGSLDGNGFTVSNLNISRPAVDYVGLFGYVRGNISRINLANVNVQGRNYTGGLLGAIDTGRVEEVTVTGSVQGEASVGGLGGIFSNTAAINSSSANVLVSGRSSLGGFIGTYTSNALAYDISAAGNINIWGTGSSGGLIGVFSSTAVLRNSHASGNVVIPLVMSSQRVGGLIGDLSSGTVEYCYATGNVGNTGFAGQNYYAIGGFIGYSTGAIEKSYATGNTSVNGLETNVGGFVGQAAGGSITNNYAMGKVFAPSPLSAGIGGFIGSSRATLKNNYSAVATSFTGSSGSSFLGKKEGGTVSGNYFDVNIAGTANSIDATPKATTDMKKKATFVGWDFDTVWSINEGVSYPQLRPYVATYSVTYNDNGSSSGQAPADSGLYPAAGAVTVLGNTGLLERSGFVFAGWNAKADGSGEDYAPGSSISMPSRNLTLYAKWIPLTYTIEAIQTQTLSPLTAGYNPGTQESKTVTITRTGTGDLANLNVRLSGTDAASFELVGPVATTLNDDKPATTFTVQAKNQLPAGTYRATVIVGSDHMTDVTFTVEQVVTEVVNAAQPVITTQPVGSTVRVGDVGPVLSIVANSTDDGQLSYQWYLNDTASTNGAFKIEGATGSSYTISTEQESDLYYYVVVTNTQNAVNGSKTAKITSAFVRVTVEEVVNAVQPTITTQPAPTTVKVGDADPVLSIAANSTDDGQLSYQWYFNDTASTNGAFKIEGATGSSYTVSTENESSRYYYVVVTNTQNGVNGNKTAKVTSAFVQVTVEEVVNAAEPTIMTQPVGSTVKVGDADPVLSVAAKSNDDGQISYQWYRNDTASTNGAFKIEGATGSSYTVSTENESSRYYYVVVTNTQNGANGNKTAEVTSAFVQVTVEEVVNAAEPTLTAQPVGSTVKVGDADPVLSVAAKSNDDGQISYQWYRNDTASTNGAFKIEGATGSSYTISTEQESDLYYYVVVTNTQSAVNGSKTAEVVSSFVRVRVEEVVNAAQPTITTQPIPSTVKVGDADPVLSIVANSTDDGQLSYQWYRNDTASTNGAFKIEGATGSSYTVSTENESDLYYYVVVTNTQNAVNGSKTAETVSAFVQVTVEEVINAAQPTITAQPVGSTVKVGDADPVLSIAANSTDDGQLSYQWYRNDTASTNGAFKIEGAIGSSYTISTEHESDLYYYVVVTNTQNAANGNTTSKVTSAFVRVTVEEVINAAQPTITTQPAPTTVKVGDADPVLSIAANSTDDGQLSYQWYRNDTASTNGAFKIEGATSSSYTISTEHESDLYYYVVVTNTQNAANGNTTSKVTSAFVKVTITGVVHAEAPWISSQPAGVTVNEGDSPVLSVTAQSTDGGILSYQWYSNMVNSVAGASAIPSVTGSTYTAPTTVLGTVYYYVVVTNTNHTINGNPIATVTSDIVAVTVNELVNAAVPVLSAQPTGAVVNLGEAGPTLNVAVHSTDGGVLSYQWYSSTSNSTSGGAVIPNATGSSYTVPTAEPGTTYYYVVVTSFNQAANGNQTATAVSVPVAVTVNPPAPTHTVMFDSQGGSAVAGVSNALHGSKLTAPVSPSKSGYSFSGWYKDAAGTAAWSFDTDLVTGDVTLYAKWTVVSNGGDTGGNSDGDTNGDTDVVSGNQSGGTPVPSSDAVIVLVNGREEKIGKSASSTEGERTITTITVNPQQLEDKLQAEGQGAVVTIPVSATSDVIVGELNGQMVKNMEDKQAVLVVQTGHASYTIPSVQVDIGSISKQLGSAALEDIKVQIRIAEPEAAMLKVGEAAAGQNGLTLVVPPVHFTVEASYEGQTVEVSKFSAYVERTIALPEGVDPNKITTGIVTEADGSVRHVPTKVTVMGGKYYAQINSLTNSMYSVIWHPLAFKDVEQHWAQQDVNDMGSRLVVNGVGDGLFNPDAAITRAEFAAIVMRGLGLKPVGGSAVFTDVQASDWYYTAVQTTSDYKLIDGFEDGTFRPNEKITREQAMLIIARAMVVTKLQGKLPAKEIGELLKPFADAAAASDWAKAGITASLQAGLVTGRSADELAPQASITRAEVATIVKRLLKESGLI